MYLQRKRQKFWQIQNDWPEYHIYSGDSKTQLFIFFFPFGGRFPYLSVKLSLQMRQNLAIPHVLLNILSQTLILMHPTVVLLIAC